MTITWHTYTKWQSEKHYRLPLSRLLSYCFRKPIKQMIWHCDNKMAYLYKMTMWKTLYASVVMVTVLLFQKDNKTNNLTLWQYHGILIQNDNVENTICFRCHGNCLTVSGSQWKIFDIVTITCHTYTKWQRWKNANYPAQVTTAYLLWNARRTANFWICQQQSKWLDMPAANQMSGYASSKVFVWIWQQQIKCLDMPAAK